MKKSVLIKKESTCACTNVRKHFTPQMSIIQFNILTYCLSKLQNRKLYFLKTFTRKRGCPKFHFLIWTYLIKMFPLILDIKNTNRAPNFFFQNSTKHRKTHFNIPVAVIHGRDNYYLLLTLEYENLEHVVFKQKTI